MRKNQDGVCGGDDEQRKREEGEGRAEEDTGGEDK